MTRILRIVIILLISLFIAGGKPLVFNIEPFPAYSFHEVQPRESMRSNLASESLRSASRRSGDLYKEPDFSITAKNVLVSDALTSEPFFTRNAHELVSIASLTKLMTALVLLDQGINFDDEVEIRSEDLRGGVPEILIPGEKVLVRDLWNLMLVSSYNTAVAALVRQVGFDEKDFVNLMRDKANELFLFEVEFTDATGLSPANRASARNVLKLARQAFQDTEITETTTREGYEFKTKNTIRLVRVFNTRGTLTQGCPLYEGAPCLQILGSKTGYLDESKFNLALKVRDDNHDIIIVILGSETKERRLEEVVNLSNWVFKNFVWPSAQ